MSGEYPIFTYREILPTPLGGLTVLQIRPKRHLCQEAMPMSNLPKYFVSTFVKKRRAYCGFYASIYQNIWNIPIAYDLDDRTLSIRLLRHTAATVAIFSPVIYVVGELTGNLYARSASNSDLFLFLLSAYFFVYGFGLVIYLANKIYPRKNLTFRECTALVHFFFIQLFPFFVVLTLFASENPAAFFKFDVLIFFHIGLIVASCTVVFRNEMVLLQLGILKTVYFQLTILVTEFALLLVFGLGTFSLFFLPESVQQFLIRACVSAVELLSRIF